MNVRHWTFDDYLGYQLKMLAFVQKGEFTITNVKVYLKDAEYLRKLYHKQFKNATWDWDDWTDRMNRHIYRVVKNLGGARRKNLKTRRWIYSLSPSLAFNVA
tara:strand:- start:1093 stop:1398 length:306 start_codon:yes stop_codon:yes gene_type:complete